MPGDGDEPSYEWLDEWLCEYVDGTMDPSLEAVFEQYVEANPELKAHVKRLQETRELLCNCGLPKEPVPDLAIEGNPEGEHDAPPVSAPETAQHLPLTAFGFVSSVTAALVIGFLMGAMIGAPSTTPLATDREADNPKPGPTVRHSTPQTKTAPPRLLLHRPPTSFPATDSTHSPSRITTIDAP